MDDVWLVCGGSGGERIDCSRCGSALLQRLVINVQLTSDRVCAFSKSHGQASMQILRNERRLRLPRNVEDEKDMGYFIWPLIVKHPYYVS